MLSAPSCVGQGGLCPSHCQTKLALQTLQELVATSNPFPRPGQVCLHSISYNLYWNQTFALEAV